MASIFGLVLLVCGQLAIFAGAMKGDLVRNRSKAHFIACPVLAGLYHRGILKPDEYGRVTEYELQSALQETGASLENSAFQALGIAGYRGDDLHQNVRHCGPNHPEGFLSRFYVNLFTMNPGDACAVAGHRTPGGFLCNANPQFQQHGYSTTIRDTRYDQEDPDRSKRFHFFIGSELVEPSSASDEVSKATKERVLLFDGFKRMLLKSRSQAASPMLSGDFNSEFSLTTAGQHKGSNIEKYHPSVADEDSYHTLATWQPLLAWTGWWAAFSRTAGETRYFTESDLKGFFIHGEYPADWTKWSWGFQDNYELINALETGRAGESGLGTRFISHVKEMLLPHNAIFDELRYTTETTAFLQTMGMFQDSVQNTWPEPQRGRSSEPNSGSIVWL